MLYFQMCNILKFTQNSLVLIPYLLIYSQQFFVTTLLHHIAFMRNVFCFNSFNQVPIVLRYSVHIKPRKRLKPLNQTTFTHKHNMTLIVSSQSIAVNKKANMEQCYFSSAIHFYSSFYSVLS